MAFFSNGGDSYVSNMSSNSNKDSYKYHSGGETKQLDPSSHLFLGPHDGAANIITSIVLCSLPYFKEVKPLWDVLHKRYTIDNGPRKKTQPCWPIARNPGLCRLRITLADCNHCGMIKCVVMYSGGKGFVSGVKQQKEVRTREKSEKIYNVFTDVAAIWKPLEERFSIVNGSRKYQLNKEIYEINTMTTEINASVGALDKEKEEQRLFQFLNGLDKAYGGQRSHVLKPMKEEPESAAMYSKGGENENKSGSGDVIIQRQKEIIKVMDQTEVEAEVEDLIEEEELVEVIEDLLEMREQVEKHILAWEVLI
ncbi:Slit-like protein 2 protein [Bienertia sinuspersici]